MPLLHLQFLPNRLPSSTASGSPTHSSVTCANLSLPLFRRRPRHRSALSSVPLASACCAGFTRTAAVRSILSEIRAPTDERDLCPNRRARSVDGRAAEDPTGAEDV
ncbi:hypothetical protein LINGRAHAP2_LOCUS20365 [Linum grandiflorum]